MITVEELGEFVGGEIRGDGQSVIAGAESLDEAGPEDVAFIADEANLQKLATSRAGAIVVGRELADKIPDDPSRAWVIVADAKAAFITVLTHLRPQRPRPEIGISPGASVSESARIGEGTNVHAGATIGDDVVVGARCEIHPGVCIGAGCEIGDDVVLHPNVVLYPDVNIGDRVTIHASSVIGADGFGYRLVEGRHEKIPHFGTVRIEADVEIGACTTIDRAMIGATTIGEGSKIDNLIVVAHNCRLGRHNVLVSQVGLAGSVTTGDYVVCAGQVGVADHVHLGDRCVLGSKAGVHKDVPAGETYIGTPARPVNEAMKGVMAQLKLPEMRKTLRRLEQQIAELTSRLESDEEQSEQQKKSCA